METETATFQCQLRDSSLEGDATWWFEGKKVENDDKYVFILMHKKISLTQDSSGMVLSS